MLRLLDELETTAEQAVSLFIPGNLTPTEIETLLKKVPAIQATTPDIIQLVTSSPKGAALFWGMSKKYLILPPFPITEEYITPGYDVGPVRSLLNQNTTIALILLRLGYYAIGICQEEKLIVSKTGTGLVHARHKKGGSSQRRFERHRENQIHHFLERVCRHVQEHLEPYALSLDYLVYGGARTTILSLKERCSHLRQFDNRILTPLLNVPKPRKSVLQEAVGDVWSSSVTEWYNNESSA